MTWGDKFTQKEIDDAYGEMVIDDQGNIDTESLIELIVGASKEEEEE